MGIIIDSFVLLIASFTFWLERVHVHLKMFNLQFAIFLKLAKNGFVASVVGVQQKAIKCSQVFEILTLIS